MRHPSTRRLLGLRLPPMNLIVRFPPPGFFLADVRTELRLDGVRIHGGSFTSGFVAAAEVAPGTHTLEALLGEEIGRAHV